MTLTALCVADGEARGFVSPMVRKALQAAQGEAGGSESPYSPKTLELLAGASETSVPKGACINIWNQEQPSFFLNVNFCNGHLNALNP